MTHQHRDGRRSTSGNGRLGQGQGPGRSSRPGPNQKCAFGFQPWVVGLASSDPERGFIIINCAFVAFGFWCLLWPMRRDWPSAAFFAWLWVVIEGTKGIGHMAWSVLQRAYTPGVVTAPILLVLTLYLASRLQKSTFSKEARS